LEKSDGFKINPQAFKEWIRLDGLMLPSNELLKSQPNWALTVDEVKSLKEFDKLAIDDIKNIIDTLVRLAIISYNAK
jgi:hypothetical protein